MPHRRRRHRLQLWALLIAPLLVSASCKRNDSAEPGQPASAATPAPANSDREDRLVVFAATSLRDAFAELAEDFKREHPGVEVSLNLAGTQELRTQLEHGAAADVFASADKRHMDELLAAARVTQPIVFARNEPVIVVATENAKKIRELADVPNASRVVVGVPEVPIGRYTLQILDRAAESLGSDFRSRVEAKIVSRELNVRQVLAKVSLGEAEVGFVYRTDANSAGDKVGVVSIAPEINVIAEYPIAIVADAAHPQLARAWMELVLASEGRRALAKAGFVAPAQNATSR
jgi:molybdate transport system substrate-binding protein